MKQPTIAALLTASFLVTACGGGTDQTDATAASGEEANGAVAETVSDDEAAERRESMIATWGANFGLTEEQATCLVDNVQWDDMIAAEQSEEVIAAITACDADPATFAGYGQ